MTSMPKAREHGVKTGGEFRITIVEEKTQYIPFHMELPRELTSLLHHPGCRGVDSAGCHMNSAGADLDEEEHIQRL